MVSLRKTSSSTPKSLFSEGERVLCYEPDVKKVKLLYDSQIIDIIPRDGCTRSNKKTEYTVHFFGWNSSWDRLVTEESILKDTPKNRQLQRELAEQAAGRLKGKKLKLNKIPTIIKEVIISSLNEQDQNAKDGYEQTSNVENVSNDEESSSSNFYTTNSNGASNELKQISQGDSTNSSSQNEASNQRTIRSVNEADLFTLVNSQLTSCLNQPANDNQNQELCQTIIANLDSELKKLLEKDQQLICNEKKLYSLPVSAEHSVNRILSEFEHFSLRMLNTSNQTKLKLKSNDQLTNSGGKNDIQSDIKKENNLTDPLVCNNQANSSINTPASSHAITRTSNRLGQHHHQSNNQASNPINQQTTNQSTQANHTNNNFVSNNSNNSSSASSLNCSNTGKQSRDSAVVTNSFTSQTIREFTNSIEIYFNTLTDKMYLFYSEKEREQFQQLKKSEQHYLKPVDAFGFIHLLRLIILLPDFLSFCSIPYKQLRQLIFLLEHFCGYLLDNRNKFTS